MKKIIYLLVGIVLFGGLYYSCAPEELPGSIYGTVVDKATGEPIKSAGVELSPSGLKTVTGSEGQFEFTELDPGKYTLLITKTGYIDGVSHTIEVKPGQQAKGDVQIEKLPPALKVVDDNRQEISILDFGSAEDDVARSFSIFNDGTESLEWELTATADWIKSVSKTSGALSAGATQSLIITIDRAKLSSGENKTTVHITSNSGNKQLVVTATNNFQVTKLNVLPTTAITSTSATLNGEVVEDGNPIYTERGFVYAETTQPTINACIQKIAVPFSDSKTFAATVSDLVEGKKYYVRAYAIQSGKEVYSANEVSFTAEGSVLPKVTTKSVTDISRSEGKAIAMGMVTEVGDPAYTERGFVYGTNHNPIVQTATKAIVEGNEVGEFVGTLSDLQLGNMYYVRAYALNTVGVAYGEEQTLDFNPILPVVVTNDVTDISEETRSATFHATITNAGDPVYTERGFVYGKSTNPLIGSAEQLQVAGAEDGIYYKNVQGLEVNIPYYVRAYLISSQGVIYGEEKVFIVEKISLPILTTSDATNITYTSATIEGCVVSDGDAQVTERGVVFNTNANPTTANNKLKSGSGTGSFICDLSNLKDGTTYYARTYAINKKGTAYGREISFTTKTIPQYVDLGLSVKWATFNIGANKPEEEGDAFQWGETLPGEHWDEYLWGKYTGDENSYLIKYNTNPAYGSVDNKTTLELGDDAAYANWGGNWRMPTLSEWKELEEKCIWIWTNLNGVTGFKVKSKSNNNSIFLPTTPSVNLDDQQGYYWSSSLYLDNPFWAYTGEFEYGVVITGKYQMHRELALPIRAVHP